MLTYDDVIKIYEFKLSWMLRPSSHTPSISIRGQSGPVGKLFGVSPRTVRDIWNRVSSQQFNYKVSLIRVLAFQSIRLMKLDPRIRNPH